MAYTIEEKRTNNYNESAQNISTTKELVLISDESMSLKQVHSAVREWCKKNPKDFAGRQAVSVNITTDESALGDVWNISIQYSTRDKADKENSQYPQQEGCITESFSTSGGTAHITQAFSESRTAITGRTLPDLGGGIGFNGDSFEGVDVVRPSFEFSISRSYDYDSITAAVKTNWANKTGCVNAFSFWGYDAGTVLFLGVSGNTRTEYDDSTIVINGRTYQKAHNYFDVQFSFRCSPNMPNYQIGGVTVSKGGHQYAWVLRETRDDSASGTTIQYPIGAYVNTVYQSADFSTLIQ